MLYIQLKSLVVVKRIYYAHLIIGYFRKNQNNETGLKRKWAHRHKVEFCTREKERFVVFVQHTQLLQNIYRYQHKILFKLAQKTNIPMSVCARAPISHEINLTHARTYSMVNALLLTSRNYKPITDRRRVFIVTHNTMSE